MLPGDRVENGAQSKISFAFAWSDYIAKGLIIRICPVIDQLWWFFSKECLVLLIA
jgi:hypothetical protein